MRTDATILITGAGGFIGGWLTESLYLRGFRNLRAGLRSWNNAARIARFPVQLVLCDLLDDKQVEEAVQGCEAVIHCGVGSREVNVRGTENILRASLAQGVSRFVHLSTVSVYGNAEGLIDERAPVKFTGSEYGDSKIEAERTCVAYSTRGLPVVVIRPSVVYGPYNRLWIEKFSERLLSGNWNLFNEIGEGKCNPIYVTDLVMGILLALDSAQAVGEVFNMNGPHIVTWNEYFKELNERLGLPELEVRSKRGSQLKSALFTPLKALGRSALNRHGELIRTAYRKYGLVRSSLKRIEMAMKTTPGNEELQMFGRNVEYSIEKARRVLGFVPQITLDRGLDLSVEWLIHELMIHKNGRGGGAK